MKGDIAMQVAIGSLNPTKVGAVRQVFGENILPLSVPSDVSNQPFSDEETMKGAINRAQHALAATDADIAIGLEGGVYVTEQGLFLCNWGALVTANGEMFLAGGARIQLPPPFEQPLRQGKELSEVMDAYTLQHDIRSKEGAIGIFTSGYVGREEMFIHVVKLLAGQYHYKS